MWIFDEDDVVGTDEYDKPGAEDIENDQRPTASVSQGRSFYFHLSFCGQLATGVATPPYLTSMMSLHSLYTNEKSANLPGPHWDICRHFRTF